MRRCIGRSRVGMSGSIGRCPYDALSDPHYCHFHRAVVEGLITDIDGKKSLSWRPEIPKPEGPEQDEGLLERLLREWDLDDGMTIA